MHRLSVRGHRRWFERVEGDMGSFSVMEARSRWRRVRGVLIFMARIRRGGSKVVGRRLECLEWTSCLQGVQVVVEQC